jgi:hypothetical protein
MMASAPRSLLDKVALFGRRSRRFGLGFEMADGPFKYKSQQASLPLSDIEEALLDSTKRIFPDSGVPFTGFDCWLCYFRY